MNAEGLPRKRYSHEASYRSRIQSSTLLQPIETALHHLLHSTRTLLSTRPRSDDRIVQLHRSEPEAERVEIQDTKRDFSHIDPSKREVGAKQSSPPIVAPPSTPATALIESIEGLGTTRRRSISTRLRHQMVEMRQRAAGEKRPWRARTRTFAPCQGPLECCA